MHQPKSVDPAVALKIVDLLEHQASHTKDPHIKRLLLTAACEIIDHTLTHQIPKKAA